MLKQYREIIFLMEWKREYGKTWTEEKRDKWAERIRELNLEIRKINRDIEQHDYQYRNIKCFYYDDYAITKTVFWKKDGWTKEDVQELADNSWLETGSAFDCSGRWFTTRMEVCECKDRIIVYRFDTIDV